MKKNTKGILTIALILVVTYFMTFVIIRPFDNMITEERPIIKKLCEMQMRCNAVIGPWPCDSIDDLVHDNLPIKGWKHKRVVSWEGYHGCNDSTSGFDGKEHVSFEYCSCGGLM